MRCIISKKSIYNSKKFINLQNKWYAKLKKSGFYDLEWLDEKSGKGQNSPYLRKNLNKFKQLTPEQIKEARNYFSRCANFYNSYDFPTLLHKFVWKCYSEGISYRNMIKLIKARGFKFVPSIFWISIRVNEMCINMAEWELKNQEEHEAAAAEAAQDPESQENEFKKLMESNEGVI